MIESYQFIQLNDLNQLNVCCLKLLFVQINYFVPKNIQAKKFIYYSNYKYI